MPHTAAKEIDCALMREMLAYDPLTGLLTWEERSAALFRGEKRAAWWNSKFAGTAAGNAHATRNGKVYIQVKMFGVVYAAHRIAWAITHGEIPAGSEIDHEDGDGTNNRLSNLRMVPHQVNAKNLRRSRSNSSGVTGVYWFASARKWVAQGQIDGKALYLGIFANFSDAVAKRREWEAANGFHANHGSAKA